MVGELRAIESMDAVILNKYPYAKIIIFITGIIFANKCLLHIFSNICLDIVRIIFTFVMFFL